MGKTLLRGLLFMLWVGASWANGSGAPTGVFAGEIGQLQLQIEEGRVVGRYLHGGGCTFDEGRPVLDGELEGHVLVGSLAVCQTGPACEERAYPILAFYSPEDETLTADVKLEEGCASPGLNHARLLLKRVGETPFAQTDAPAKKAEKDCLKAFERAQHLLQRVDWAGAAYYFQEASSCNEQFWPAHLGLGVAELRRGKVDEAVKSMEKARDLAREKEQEDAGIFYDLACAKARQGDARAALANLRQAVDLGWSDPLAMSQDPDLEALRGEAEFKSLVDRAWKVKGGRRSDN